MARHKLTKAERERGMKKLRALQKKKRKKH
jgi:hypothetical protein